MSRTSVLLLDAAAAAVGADLGDGARHGDLAAVGAVPGGDAMAPPELARDAPVVDVPHPLEVRLGILFGRKADVALLHRGNCRVGQRLNPDKPLGRKQGLNDRLAAVALADGVDVVAHPGQHLLHFKIGENLLPCLVAVEAGIGAGCLVHVRRLVHHLDRGQPEPLPQSEIVGVVRGRHLDRAGAELAADPGVGHDGDLAPGQRQAEHLSVQVGIAFIVRMNGDGDIAQHGLGAGSRHSDGACFPHDRVANLP